MNKSAAKYKNRLQRKAKEVKMSVARNMAKTREKENLGLTAIGCDGGWEVAIDETTSGAQKWFAQIEGHSIYLSFAVRSPRIIDAMLEFLTLPGAENGVVKRSTKNDQILIGKNKEEPVTLVRDDEFSDRCFLIAEAKSGLIVRVAIGGADLSSLVGALRQAKEDLDEADTE